MPSLALGARGMRMAGDVLLCCATITATITTTATAPHVAPAAGAVCQGLDVGVSSGKWGSPCSLWVLLTHLSRPCARSQVGSVVGV